MGQKENKEQLLRLLSIVKGCPQTLEKVTRRWNINPNGSLIHDSSGKVVTGHAISISDYYPLVTYPLRSRLDKRTKAASAR